MNPQIDNRGYGSNDSLYNMIRILSRRSSGLNICHINAQSLNNKMDEFRLIFENSYMDIICISESWFNVNINDNIYDLEGYRVLRSDRKSHGGGVAIYIKQEIFNQYRCRVLSEQNLPNIEHLFIEMHINDTKLLLGTIYRPYRNIDVEPLISYLSSTTLDYTDIILTGDFNANIIADKRLMFDMSAIGLFLVNQTVPTHFTSSTSTLIDLYFVGDRTKILRYEQLSAAVFSKHDLIFLSYDFGIRMNEATIWFKDFRNIDLSSLEAELMTIPWNNIFSMPSVDEQATFLHDNIQYLYVKYVATRMKKIKPLEKPWFTNEIRQLINGRNRAYERWKRFRTTELKNLLKMCRKNVNSKIRQEKSRYYENKFNSAMSSKKKWNEIRRMGVISKKNITEHVSDANHLNQEFLNIPMPTADINFYQSHNGHQAPGFEFSNVTSEDIVIAFKSIKSESVGHDEMHPKFLKIILKYILNHICHLFNTIIMSSEFPSMWKISKIIPISKPDKSYRPIAILPYLSKVFEKLIHTQMSRYLYENKLLSKRQSGFRPGHSCVTTLINVSEELRTKLDKNMICFLILLDHSKAFDTVDHNILCHKLRYLFNFSTTATKLFSTYLSNRFQSVHFGQEKSDICEVIRGVPQGSILGPLLYAIYSNDLPLQVNYCNMHMYADDVQLYISCSLSDVNDTIIKINHDLRNVYKWASANGLNINASKSKCILIGKNTNTIDFPISPLFIGDSSIEFVDQVKNLGIIFNKQLDWSNHVNTICGKTHIMLRNLWKTQFFTPFRIRLLLAKTYILPTLMYGCELYVGLDSVTRRKLNVTFNNIARYVYKQGRFSNISHLSKHIFNLSFDDYLKFRVLKLFHKIIYTRQPEYLFEKIEFSRSNRGKKVNAIGYCRLISERHFFVISTRLWNLLPSNIQILSNARQFKSALFRYLNM